MKVIVINSGSTSVKFRLYDMAADIQVAEGNYQRVGLTGSELKYVVDDKKFLITEDVATHKQALERIFSLLTTGETKVLDNISQLTAAGHRVSMGGPNYVSSVLVDDAAITEIESYSDITPLHTPPQLMGIKACREILGDDFPNIAAFDTAFHQTIPKEASTFAIPREYREKYNVRRYGFHGLSHHYVTDRYAEITGKNLQGTHIVTCHLGGGSSATAVKDGKSIDNTFGIGTGQGLLCGSRAGDFDHVAIGYLMSKTGLDYAGVEEILHKSSGLMGLSGISADEKEIEDRALEGHAEAIFALDCMALQLKKYIGGYAFEMGGLDTIIFTGGIGENSDYMRKLVCDGLEGLGIVLDAKANAQFNRREHLVSTPDSKVEVWIIPTNEELIIARDTAKIAAQFEG